MRKIAVILLGLTLLVVAGCSNPPAREEKQALDALDLARQAKADIYAPEAFTAAQDTLDNAVKERERQDEKFKLFRSYSTVREQFLRATELANKSIELANGEKNRQSGEASALLMTATAKVDTCANLLDIAPSAKGARADIKMLRDDLSVLATELGDASTALSGGNFAESRQISGSIIMRADSLNIQITRAIEKKK